MRPRKRKGVAAWATPFRTLGDRTESVADFDATDLAFAEAVDAAAHLDAAIAVVIDDHPTLDAATLDHGTIRTVTLLVDAYAAGTDLEADLRLCWRAGTRHEASETKGGNGGHQQDVLAHISQSPSQRKREARTLLWATGSEHFEDDRVLRRCLNEYSDYFKIDPSLLPTSLGDANIATRRTLFAGCAVRAGRPRVPEKSSPRPAD
jgi:hypothetical protein